MAVSFVVNADALTRASVVLTLAYGAGVGIETKQYNNSPGWLEIYFGRRKEYYNTRNKL